MFKWNMFSGHRRLFNQYKLDKKDWLLPGEFTAAVKAELKRSYRTGAPLSYIKLELIDSRKGQPPGAKHNKFLFFKELLAILNKHSRDGDLKCILSGREVDLLLIDTSIEGARGYFTKISKIIRDYFEEHDRDFLALISELKISLFPLNNIPEKSDLDTILEIREKKTGGEHHVNGITLKMYSGSTKLSPGLNFYPNGNGTLTAAMPRFWHINHDQLNYILYRFRKRIIDIAGSLCAIILFMPLMIIIGIGIKMTSRGPVFFKQTRIGHRGKEFTFYKFRTMRIDMDDQIHRDYVKKLIQGRTAELNNGSAEKPVFKITKDPRVTRLGAFLRKYSLDELPQFINVLAGSMSLVGPRPPIPYEVELYKSWHMRRIFEVKPGITGVWQVYGRSMTTFDDMVRMDLQYVKKMSVIYDLKLILKTIYAVIRREGAY